MNLSLSDLDKLSVGFIIDLIEERNTDNDKDEVIEATPEIMKSFF